MIKLNIGCGNSKRPGYLNIDKIPDCNPDQIVDLEKPWPFADNSVSEIQASHVLEHLGQATEQFIFVLKEMYRVCMDSAPIYIQVPHHEHWTFHADPTHVRKILPETLVLFDQKINRSRIEAGHADTPLGIYCKVDFELVKTVPYYDEPWATRIRNQTITQYDLQFAAQHYTNVIVQWDFELRVRKNAQA